MEQKRLVILGGGESGVGAAILGKQKNYDVFLSEYGSLKPIYRKELEDHGIEFEEGGHTMSKILSGNLIIKSPGIPEKAPAIEEIRKERLPVISEIEFAARHTDATIVGITGSNGKTTTTSLLYHILKNAKADVGLGGNIGTSLARQVAIDPKSIYVVELSSFQLDDIDTFKPHISILTNITEDHLDRYEYKFENYIRSKFQVAKNQNASDYFIYCQDDPVSMQYMHLLPVGVQQIGFTLNQNSVDDTGAYINQDQVVFHLKKKNLTCQSKSLH